MAIEIIREKELDEGGVIATIFEHNSDFFLELRIAEDMFGNGVSIYMSDTEDLVKFIEDFKRGPSK